jgi:hypothetical protein
MPERRDRLSAPFPASALRWRVLEFDTAEKRSRLGPELAPEAVYERLDEVLGRDGWSNRYLPLGADALVCELTVDGVTKSAVVRSRSPHDDPETVAASALSRAAERFGLCPPVPAGASAWVDADPDTGEPLHPPAVAADAAPAFESGSAPLVLGSPPLIDKPAGHQAIDRLVERLADEGFGLAAAKLLIEYGGYGDDPDTARDLYARLRSLLRDRPVAG